MDLETGERDGEEEPRGENWDYEDDVMSISEAMAIINDSDAETIVFEGDSESEIETIADSSDEDPIIMADLESYSVYDPHFEKHRSVEVVHVSRYTDIQSIAARDFTDLYQYRNHSVKAAVRDSSIQVDRTPLDRENLQNKVPNESCLSPEYNVIRYIVRGKKEDIDLFLTKERVLHRSYPKGTDTETFECYLILTKPNQNVLKNKNM